MALPQKYRVDPDVASNVARRFMKRRYNAGSEGLSAEEQSALRFALQRLNHAMARDALEHTLPYIE